MTKRTKTFADRRLNWRDPKMPVLRDYQMRDGTIRKWADPDYERGYREHMLNTAAQPSWRDDPTYNLRRKP